MIVEEHPEIEEGEALDWNDPYEDYNVDLSYFDDKVQSLLGHFQKDFEGDITAEILGARHGGYGSFLPVYPRSPQRPESRTPTRVPTPNVPGSSSHIPTESFGRNSSISVHMGPAPSTPGTRTKPPQHSSKVPIAACGDASTKQNSAANFDRTESQQHPSRNNPLKVRIKVHPVAFAHYNQLGLISPSISGESSSEESAGSPIESHETLNISPARILLMMTSYPVADSMLLSPLCAELLNKFEAEHLVDGDYEAVAKSSVISGKPLTTNSIRFKKQENVGGREKLENSLNRCNGKASGRWIPECLKSFNDLDDKHMPDLVTDPEMDIQVRKKRVSKGRVKGREESGDSLKVVSLALTSEKSYCKLKRRDSRCDSADKVFTNQARISDNNNVVDDGQGRQKLEQRNSRCDSADKVLKNRARISQNNNVLDDGQGMSSGNRRSASLKAHHDTSSDGKRVKGASDKLRPKVGQPPTFDKTDSRLGYAVDNLKPEKKLIVSQTTGKLLPDTSHSLQDRGCDAQKNGSSGKKVHLGKNGVTDARSEYTESIKHVPERPPSVWPKNSDHEPAKKKPKQAIRLKDRSTKQQDLGGVNSLACTMGPPVAAISSTGVIVTGQGENVEESWVECERCEKWRLLPYGTTMPENIEHWTCSMLDWLQGMVNCDVSEAETTNAVQSTYPPYTVSQYGNHALAPNTNHGGLSAGFSHNNESFSSGHASDQIKKLELKDKQMNMVPLERKRKLQRLSLQTGDTKETNQIVEKKHAQSTLGLQPPNNSATEAAKLKKRKDEHVIDDDTILRKRIKIKVAGNSNLVNFQKSGGSLVTSSHGLTSGSSNKAAMKDVKKENTQKGKGKSQIHFKIPQSQMQDLPSDGALGIKAFKSKRVLKDYGDDQHQVQMPQNSGSYLQPGKVSVQEQKDGDIHRDTRPQLSQVEDKDSKRCNMYVIPKREVVDRSRGNKECTTDRSINIEQQAQKNRVKGVLTPEDHAKLQQDLTFEKSTATMSNSSKVSDTRRIKIRYVGMRSSPGESVSSSPARTAFSHQVPPIMMAKEVKTKSGSDNVSARGSVKKSVNSNEGSEMGIGRKAISTGTSLGSSGNPVLDFRETEARINSCVLASGAFYGHNDGPSKNHINTVLSHPKPDKNLVGSTAEKISCEMDQQNEADKHSAPCPSKRVSGVTLSRKRSVDSRPAETSVVNDSSKSKSLKDTFVACHQKVMDDYICCNATEKSLAMESSPVNKNSPNGFALKKAKSVLSEAERLRSHADLIKKSNFGPESNDTNFQAALKFLQGASLLEACNGESGKNLELNPIDAYGTAARLCKTCAVEYQKDHEVAAAALAYKCVHVACMRIVQIKRSAIQRVCYDLNSSLQFGKQGESPSSSASDVDNLNNSLYKGNVPHSGNHNILAGNHGVHQLLDFAGESISAMEAVKNSQDMFQAACITLEDSPNKEAIDSVKKAIDLSFQDVDNFVRLVSKAHSTLSTAKASVDVCRN